MPNVNNRKNSLTRRVKALVISINRASKSPYAASYVKTTRAGYVYFNYEIGGAVYETETGRVIDYVEQLNNNPLSGSAGYYRSWAIYRNGILAIARGNR